MLCEGNHLTVQPDTRSISIDFLLLTALAFSVILKLFSKFSIQIIIELNLLEKKRERERENSCLFKRQYINFQGTRSCPRLYQSRMTTMVLCEFTVWWFGLASMVISYAFSWSFWILCEFLSRSIIHNVNANAYLFANRRKNILRIYLWTSWKLISCRYN